MLLVFSNVHIPGYLQSRTCLSKDEVREGIEECFKPYMNYTRNHPYKTIKNSDARVREHCAYVPSSEVFPKGAFTLSEMDTDSDKLVQNPMRICVDIASIQIYAIHFLLASLSVVV